MTNAQRKALSRMAAMNASSNTSTPEPTNNNAFWSVQAAIADTVSDPEFKTILRIDIPKSEDAPLPNLGGRTFAFEESALHDKFPGRVIVFNGKKSVLKKVESGTISFTPDSSAADHVNGSFDVVLIDYDVPTVPAPRYHLRASFSFQMGTYGPAAL